MGEGFYLDKYEEPGLEGENTGNNFVPPKDRELKYYNYEDLNETDIDEAFDSIDSMLSSEEQRAATDTLWEERYREDPDSFWQQESMEFLKGLTPGERVRLLLRASRFLNMHPSDTFLYCQNFPQDISALAGRFFDNSGPVSSFEFKLLSLLVDQIELSNPTLLKNARWIKQYKGIFERRKLARDHLLYPDVFYINEEIEEVDKGSSRDYFGVLNQAVELDVHGNKMLDTSRMFNDSFEKLSLEQKIDFIKKCIAQLHNILVESETFNSQFSANTVKQRSGRDGYYNVAHSMLYGTRQPSSAYEEAQEIFEHQMNNTAAIGGRVEEYPFHRMLLTAIRKVTEICKNINDDERFESESELRSVTEMLVDLWDKNRNPIFANSIAESLTTLDATYSARLLLDRVKGEKEDKTALASILYRLEFGKIGISKEGVKYLERVYDLGEFNNPDYFVNRLTSRGEVGIFDEQNNLVRYFYLEDFNDENRDDALHPAVLEFAYDTLFVPKENETEGERKQRLEYLEEFKNSYFDFYDAKFLERTGVRFNNLSFKEQGSFLLFAKSVGDPVKEKLYDFCRSQGEVGMRLFLLINQKDFLLGQRVLGLSENVDSQTMEMVTSKISSILAELENVTDFVDGDPRLRESIKLKLPEIQRKIINKALEAIEKVFDIVSVESEDHIDEEGGENKDESKSEKIFKILSNINTEAVLLASTLTTARRLVLEEPIDNLLNSFSDTGLYDYEGHEFSSEDMEQIHGLYRKNYASAPKLAGRLFQGFLKKIEEQKTEFKVIRYKDRIVAINAFEHLDEGNIYFGKFNVDPFYQGSELGKEMMENTLDDFACSYVIHADCDINAPVSSNYIERGFIGIHSSDLDEIKDLEIVENKSLNDTLDSKGWIDYYISEQAKVGEQVSVEDGRFIIYACDVKDVASAPLSILENVDEDGSRYVMSRYIREKRGKKEGDKPLAYFVFEKQSKEVFEIYCGKFVRPDVVETSYGVFV